MVTNPADKLRVVEDPQGFFGQEEILVRNSEFATE
jgi:hypothetical protein